MRAAQSACPFGTDVCCQRIVITPSLTLAGLELLSSAAALRSFSAAGDALGYSQSAVSRRIAALERAVGAPLFERAPRGVRLTEAGTLLLGHATTALGELDAARAAILRLGERMAGQLAVGAIPTAGIALVPRAIVRLAVSHPEVRVELYDGSTPALIERVASGSLDLAVVALRPAGRDQDFGTLRPELLLVDPLRVAVASTHRLAGRGRVEADELRDEPWIVGRPTVDDEPVFEAWPSLQAPKIAFAARDWPARLGLVAAGLGVALMPGLAAPSVPAGVVLIDVDDPKHARDPSGVTITAPGGPPAAAAMVAALRAEAARFAMTRAPGERPPASG
jgi:DNA-binding transcriptional LysR family regulator